MPKNRFVVVVFLILCMIFEKGCSSKSGSSNNPVGSDLNLLETGTASWYGDDFQGKRTANGEVFDMNKLTAAHKTLPFGTNVEVTNLTTGRQVIVKINDRGPYAKDRIIDVSKRSAIELGMIDAGTVQVSLKILSTS